MTDCVFHPENLVRDCWYKFHFGSAVKGEFSCYVVRAKFIKLSSSVGETQVDAKQQRTRLKVVLKVHGEQHYRKLSWVRITKIEVEG